MPLVVCGECGNNSKHKAFGLCQPCYRKQYYRKNRDREIQTSTEWLKQNSDRRNQYKRERWSKVSGHSYQRHKRVLELAYGSLCQLCQQEFDLDDLQVDHIHPIAKMDTYAGDDIHEYVNLQLLCKPCNISKGDRITGRGDETGKRASLKN